jgi:hypothetical protein
MKKLLLVLFISAISQGVWSQNMGSSYTTAIGAKGYFAGGSIGGISVKHFLTKTTAIEGNLIFGNNLTVVEGLYAWHGAVNGAKGLQWYVGPGAWLGSTKRQGDSELYFAAKGTVGLDYKFTGAPISVALDVNPHLRFTQNTDFDFYTGLAFRFAL